MGRRRRVLAPATLLAAVTAACGGAAQPSSATCTPSPTPSPPGPPVAVVGAVTVTADRTVLPGGATLGITAAVAGPLRYRAACEGPVELVAVDSADVHVFGGTPPAERGAPCGDVTLPAGQTATYHLRWDVDPALPPGRYTLGVTVGDQAEVTLTVAVTGLAVTGGC